MNYLSIGFAALVCVLWCLYRVLPQFTRPIVLLIGSVVFYATFGLSGFVILLFTAVSTFVSALLIQRRRHSKLWLCMCVVANIGVWLSAKVLPWVTFMLARAGNALGMEWSLSSFSIPVAMGMSYFMLQAVGYVADVYLSKASAERSFWKYLLFLTYFPAVVQGPISRYHRLMPQLCQPHLCSFVELRQHLLTVLLGLVKKMVIADRMGLFVNYCFAEYSSLSGVVLYLGVVAYALQLYLDFSGCVDLCRGVSGLFGVELPHNFDRPYLARSIREFWQRWHISLSQWLRDYVYIPLGGNRRGTWRKYLNLLVTFLVSGLWHGAGFSFFLWGALHAFYQIVGQCTQKLRERVKTKIGIKKDSFSERLYQTVITFHLVLFAWIFFRADSLTEGVRYIKAMFSSSGWWYLFDGSIYEMGVGQNAAIVLLIHLMAICMVYLRTKGQKALVMGIERQHIAVRWLVYYVLIFDVVLFGVYGVGYDLSGFMYGGF